MPSEKIPEFHIDVFEGPKRQHYLSEFYIDGFSRDGLVWVYDRKRRESRRQAPKNTAVESHLYTYEGPDGKRRYDIEEMLSKVESGASAVIKSLDEGGQLTDQQRDYLSLYTAFTFARTPGFLLDLNLGIAADLKRQAAAIFSDEEAASIALAKSRDHAGGDNGVTAAEVVDFVKAGAYTFDLHRNYVLAQMLKLAPRISIILYFLDWVIAHPKSAASSFSTSDQPVQCSVASKDEQPVGLCFDAPGAMITFPLSKRSCLIAHGKGFDFQHQRIDDGRVRLINLATTNACYRFVFARDLALLENLVARSGVDNKKWAARVSFASQTATK